MSRFQLFYNSIGKKLLVAATGLFLILFLVVHLAGNFQLLIPEDQGGKLAFNEYTAFMTSFPVIKIVSYFTYAAILLHAFLGIFFAVNSKSKRPEGYAYSGNKNSTWASRNMGVLGTLILAFIVMHLYNFWWKIKFGPIPTMTTENGEILKDMYTVVISHFKQPLFVILYVVSMAIIGFHLKHGFQSGFQTLGLNHPKYSPVINSVGIIFSIIIPAGFALIPVYIYFMP
ncbi:MAG: succinate dehydrogenase cytochrome b subunit [Bacteroidia bacterium]|nr:succinate dehydrogenase cytochrome b subunit [Bacteroidia bacterium]